jgi:hypothetical protein
MHSVNNPFSLTPEHLFYTIISCHNPSASLLLGDPMPYKRTGRPPGAPRNNHNALTHGLYSRHMSVQVAHEVDAMPVDHNDDELAFSRARLDQLLQMQRAAPPEHWLSYERVIAYYLHSIAALIHKNAVLGRDSRTSFVTVLEMIRQTNEQQKVR